MGLVSKIIKTCKLLKVNGPQLKKELKDLTGVTKIVIEQLIEIWKVKD